MTILQKLRRAKSSAFVGAREPDRWGGSRVLDGIERPLRLFRPVLALTVLRADESSCRILVGVRDPKSNKTHPNVASVPTRRVKDPFLANTWIAKLRRAGGRGIGLNELIGLRAEVEVILAQKLGLADPIELGTVEFDIFHLSASQGISVIGELDDGSPLTESLTMFNVGIVLRAESADLIPSSTASYSDIVWADVDKFAAMVDKRDVGYLGAGLENYFYCAYGLCIDSSATMIRHVGLTENSRRDEGDDRGRAGRLSSWPRGLHYRNRIIHILGLFAVVTRG